MSDIIFGKSSLATTKTSLIPVKTKQFIIENQEMCSSAFPSLSCNEVKKRFQHSW